ncbi:tRNA methyltransferase ppm2, partial [Teratosphaeriaceae sp. CCFEE 6253]
GMSVAVNIFFRNLPQTSSSAAAAAAAAGRDVYGTRDLGAYERGRREIERIVKSFDGVPADVSGFYLERLANELMDRAKAVADTSQLHTMYAELS